MHTIGTVNLQTREGNNDCKFNKFYPFNECISVSFASERKMRYTVYVAK